MQRLFPHKHLPRPAESGQPPDGSEVQATSFEMDKVELRGCLKSQAANIWLSLEFRQTQKDAEQRLFN